MSLLYLCIPGILCMYFFSYYAVGMIATHVFPTGKEDVTCTLITGFFLYHFLFNIVTLPMKVFLCPLKALSITWGIILILIFILFILLQRKHSRTHAKFLRDLFAGKEKYTTILLSALILVQAVLYNLNDETRAIWDQLYYLGDSASSLYTNTISQYDPYTGHVLKYLNTEYLLETYQNHTSVMCQLLGLHPMIENLTIMATVVIILYQFIVFEIGKCLFNKDRKKSLLFTGFLALFNFYSFNLFTAAEFLIIRPSEGKTILAALIFPTLLYFFLETAKDPADTVFWRYSLMAILGSFGLNMSSIFMIPFEIGTLYLPLALQRKKMSIVIRCMILMLPCIIYMALYLLTKNFLIYTGK